MERYGINMAEIKRGVSLYSYQQEQFFKRMTWKDMFREVHDNLKCDGIEITDETIIRDYPFPSEQFIFEFNNELARYNLNAVTMDVYFDPMQFRDHVMNYEEGLQRLKNDIVLASRLGFKNVRCLVAVPIEIIEAAIPTAEKYNIRIGKEIHIPFPIRRRSATDTSKDMGINLFMCEEVMELVDRTGTKHVGLVPDFGIFQHSPSQVSIDYQKRHTSCPEAIDFIVENRLKLSVSELKAKVAELYPAFDFNNKIQTSIAIRDSVAKPEELLDIIPYIISIHGKFYDMTEIPGQPGQYEDKSTDYENAIRYLVQGGYNGYINSEFEGQRDQQDRGEEYLVDEVEQVRRHHEMMDRLIKKYKDVV